MAFAQSLVLIYYRKTMAAGLVSVVIILLKSK